MWIWKVRRRAVTVTVALAVGVWLAALSAVPAVADEEGESDQASVLVLQAIGIMVAHPEEMDQILEKVQDALTAPHTEGVDLARVGAARDALEKDDMEQARTLLQQSLAGAPTHEATGEETGTVVVEDPLDPRGHVSRTDWVLLGISVLVALLGAGLAVRHRPPLSVRDLRRQLGTPPSRPTAGS